MSITFRYHYNLKGITGTLHEYQHAFTIASSCIHLRMRNVSVKNCRNNQNRHFGFNNFFPRKSFVLWDNMEKYGSQRDHRWQYKTVHALCMLGN